MLREFCGGRVVEKVRYLVPYGGFVWEVDEYFGENEGLFTAEIELDGEEVSFSVPPWLGPEVSADRRYSNGALSRNRTGAGTTRRNRHSSQLCRKIHKIPSNIHSKKQGSGVFL